MSRTAFAFTAPLAALALAACPSSSAPSSGPATPRLEARAAGQVAFDTVRAVHQHQRYQNCNPAGDAPQQGDDGRVHDQHVQRGPTGHGAVGAGCTTCHGPANPPSNYGLHIPPGVSVGWHMPKPEEKLVFVGMSPRALCEQVKDPARNGGKDMAALRVHLHDPLVLWGWSPGFGRAPVPTPHAEYVAAWEAWDAAGAPCPD